MSFPTNSIGVNPAAMPATMSDPREANALYERGKNWEHGVDINLRKAFVCYLEGAKKGNSAAMYQVALFFHGKYPESGVPTSEQDAEKWYRQSMGDGAPTTLTPDQLYNRFWCHYKGVGKVGQNLREALHWLRESAEKGHPEAMYHLGQFYQYGAVNDEEDLPTAAKWFLRSAQAGNVLAMLEIARSYEFGDGVGKDPAQATFWYRQSWNGDTAEHMYARGVSFLRGFGENEKDLNKGEEELRKSAAKNCTAATLAFGLACVSQELLYEKLTSEFKESIKRAAFVEGIGLAFSIMARFPGQQPLTVSEYLKRAAAQGEREATSRLAYYYSDGPQPDLRLAFHYHLKAAKMGMGYNMTRVAGHLFSGNAVAEDIPAAICYWHKAAEKGSAYALKHLADLYLERDSRWVEQDKVLARSYLEKAIVPCRYPLDPESLAEARAQLDNPALWQ